MLAAWCLAACVPGCTPGRTATGAVCAHVRPHPLVRGPADGARGHCHNGHGLESPHGCLAPALRGGIGIEEDVDTGESEWVLSQDWKGVNDWGRTDEWGNPLAPHAAGSSEPESSSFLLGPTPRAAREDDEVVGVGDVQDEEDQDKEEQERGLELERETETQMREAITQFEEMFLPVCERKAREREREAAREGERYAEQQRQQRLAQALGNINSQSWPGEATQTPQTHTHTYTHSDIGSASDTRTGERTKGVGWGGGVHCDGVGCGPSDPRAAEGSWEDGEEEDGEGTFKSDSTDEAIFWGFTHNDPFDVFAQRPLAENAHAHMRYLERAAHYKSWLFKGDCEGPSLLDPESRFWHPAQKFEHSRRLREEAVRKGSPWVRDVLFNRARLFKRLHLLVAQGNGVMQGPDMTRMQDMSERQRRKTLERAWEAPPFLLFHTELGNFTIQLLWSLNQRACRQLSHGVRHGLLDGSHLPLRVVPQRLLMGGRSHALAEDPHPHDLKYPLAAVNKGEQEDGVPGPGGGGCGGESGGGRGRVIAGNYTHALGAIDTGAFYPDVVKWAQEQFARLKKDSVTRGGKGTVGGCAEQGEGDVVSGSAAQVLSAEEVEVVAEERESEAPVGGWEHVVCKSEPGAVYVPLIDAEGPGAGDTLSAPEVAPSFVIATGEDPLLFRTHTLVGVVCEGLEVVQRMSQLALDEEEAPITPNHVISARASLLSQAALNAHRL